MSENNIDNPLEGFKNLAAYIMPVDNLEVKDVASVPDTDLGDTLGADTGIKDLTKSKPLSDGVEHLDDDQETEDEKKRF